MKLLIKGETIFVTDFSLKQMEPITVSVFGKTFAVQHPRSYANNQKEIEVIVNDGKSDITLSLSEKCVATYNHRTKRYRRVEIEYTPAKYKELELMKIWNLIYKKGSV